MNDKYELNSDMQNDLLEDNDPLAELARIVAGEVEAYDVPNEYESDVEEAEVSSSAYVEPELSVQETVAVDHEPVPEYAEEPSYPEMEGSLESELLAGFGSVDEMSASVPDTGIDEAAMNEIAAAMQKVDADIESQLSPIDMVELDTQPAPEETVPDEAYAAEDVEQGFVPADELSFEDEMNAALAAPEPEIEPEIAPVAVEEQAVEMVAVQEVTPPMEAMSFDDELMSALDQELVGEADFAPEPIGMEDFQPEAPIEYEEPVLEPEVYEAVEQPLVEQVEPESIAVATPIAPATTAMPEEDLGKAFANQFDQMIGATNPVEASPEVEFPVIDEATRSLETAVDEVLQATREPYYETPAFDSAIADEPFDIADVELDFEAAFAEELNTQDIPALKGWDEVDTADANAAFVQAALPEHAHMQPPPESGYGQPMPAVDDGELTQAAMPTSQNADGGRKYAVVALVIALFAGVITAGYGFLGGDTNGSGADVPIIQASTDPVKVKPENPGGRIVANQDNASYGKVEGNEPGGLQQENLVSTTEEPAIIDTEALQAADAPGIVPATNLQPKGDDRLASSNNTESAGAALNATVKPRVVQVVTVKPDGTIVRTPINKPISAEQPTQVAAVETSGLATEATPVETQVIKPIESIDGAKTTNATGIPTASPLPKPKPAPKPKVVVKPKPVVQQVAVVTPQQTNVASSEWVVQVSSQRSPEAARQSFNTMRNRFSALQGRSMAVQQANVNGATYYRVRVQTASRSDATQLCTQIANAGGNCFVTR